MGAVYEARHRSTARKVAVKIMVPAALASGVDSIARFEREARASGSIDSPFVVQVFDAGVDAASGAPSMVMECLAGEDVQAAVVRLGPLPEESSSASQHMLVTGLQKAHDAGIVHRASRHLVGEFVPGAPRRGHERAHHEDPRRWDREGPREPAPGGRGSQAHEEGLDAGLARLHVPRAGDRLEGPRRSLRRDYASRQ